ncbi:MAG: phosphoribosylanthranilate isomerase [Nevskia sp.]|nr:phosphoribosylanthranilate isomerase [Nevskia sp.]
MPDNAGMKQRTRIKFCGITRLEDATQAIELGVDAIGLILVPGSPRQLSLQQAATIRRSLPPFVSAVVLLRNPAASLVRQVLQELQPELLQFHGEESAEFCDSFGVRYLKAIAMRDAQAPLDETIRPYAGATALLFDGHQAGALGGQGLSFDWRLIRDVSTQPLIVAGGLSADNVGDAIRIAQPFAVDVSSGIESAPGCKDSGKMADFVSAVARADRALLDRALQ